jgi:hypothetical protein
MSHVGTRRTRSFTRATPVKSCRDIFNKDKSLFQSQNRTDSRMAFELVDSSTCVRFSLLHVSSQTFSELARRGHFRDPRPPVFTRPNKYTFPSDRKPKILPALGFASGFRVRNPTQKKLISEPVAISEKFRSLD